MIYAGIVMAAAVAGINLWSWRIRRRMSREEREREDEAWREDRNNW